MIDIERIKKVIEEEYDENYKKIDELSEKIRIVKVNDFESKLLCAFAFSLLAWMVGIFLAPTMLKSGVIPTSLISPLSLVVSVLIGITGETLLSKKYKHKEKLREFSSAKNQKEKIAESARYEIEKEKIISSNRVLKKVYDSLETRQKMVKTLSNEYDIVEKDSRESKEIELSIKKISKILDEKEKNIDIVTTKCVLKEKFWRVRDRFQKIFDFVVISMVGGTGAMILYACPIIFINGLGSNVVIQTSVLSPLSALGVGVLVCGGYTLKRIKDYVGAFKSVNETLGENKLSDVTNDSEVNRKTINNDIERFDIELENLINENCVLRLELESEKEKLSSLSQGFDERPAQSNVESKQIGSIDNEAELTLSNVVSTVDENMVEKSLEENGPVLKKTMKL